MRHVIRNLLEGVLSRFGYELKAKGAPPRGPDLALARLKNHGFYPKTVFDIGVGFGTPWLYKAFPKAHFVLIEPIRDFERDLKKICQKYDAEYHLMGAGAAVSERKIRKSLGNLTGASFKPRTNARAKRLGQTEENGDLIPIRPLDAFAHLPGPFLIKMDTEGYELEVLRGAQQTLTKTEVILSEVAVVKRHLGEAEFAELINELSQAGFALSDIFDLGQFGSNGPLIYLDAVFVRRTNPLWRDAF